ncbi:hypothetical protein XK97_16260 [Obesumbacterium proteus]|uniref:SrfA family protein n=1 Tax=Obesumbacterium proteus TaxID=82983 RepID=UPI0006211A33|nr:SrfA family protein [Obesumbacterium proteus]KKI43511.1 hypothetical protein XK97_16260 [Obesumbacterium proteus]
MAKILLRSGYSGDFLALGENGQSIFDSARQIRETLRLRKQQMLADCLAIPQSNDAEDKVDWYAPYSGTVTPWSMASELQRTQALRYLDNCLLTASEMSQRSLKSEKSAEQLFGILLQNAIRFPGSQHVYLVDDKPVLTFWGFSDLNASPEQHALSCLYASMAPEPVPVAPPVLPEPVPEYEPIQVDDPEPVVVTLSTPDKPLLTPEVAPSVVPKIDEPPAPRTRSWRKKILTVLALAVVLAGLLAWPWLSSHFKPAAEPVAAPPAKMVKPPVVAKPIAPPVITPAKPVEPPVVAKPPVVTETPPEPPQPVKAVEPEPEVPPIDALVLHSEAVKLGTTEFLDGIWRVSLEANDAIANLPSSMRYQISKNEGQARLVMKDNRVCRGDIYSGLMQSGNLMIKPRSRAKCADGSRVRIPEIVCSQALTGAAQCSALYENDITIPAKFKRVRY